jgi:hypothetical protein
VSDKILSVGYAAIPMIWKREATVCIQKVVSPFGVQLLWERHLAATPAYRAWKALPQARGSDLMLIRQPVVKAAP